MLAGHHQHDSFSGRGGSFFYGAQTVAQSEQKKNKKPFIKFSLHKKALLGWRWQNIGKVNMDKPKKVLLTDKICYQLWRGSFFSRWSTIFDKSCVKFLWWHFSRHINYVMKAENDKFLRLWLPTLLQHCQHQTPLTLTL